MGLPVVYALQGSQGEGFGVEFGFRLKRASEDVTDTQVVQRTGERLASG